MKRLTIWVALMLVPSIAFGQVPVPAEAPLVNQYIADTFQKRSDTWWRALESQLILTLEKPIDDVDENVLRNIVFFAHSHRDHLDLTKASPALLNIYIHHQNDGYKILALAALHAIGDRYYLREAFQYAKASNSDRILKMSRAALADVQRKR